MSNKDDLAASLTRITDDNHNDEKFSLPAGKETAPLSIPDKVEALIGKAQISDTVFDDLNEIRHLPHNREE